MYAHGGTLVAAVATAASAAAAGSMAAFVFVAHVASTATDTNVNELDHRLATIMVTAYIPVHTGTSQHVLGSHLCDTVHSSIYWYILVHLSTCSPVLSPAAPVWAGLARLKAPDWLRLIDTRFKQQKGYSFTQVFEWKTRRACDARAV